MSKRCARIIGVLIGVPILLRLCIQLIPIWLLQNSLLVQAEPHAATRNCSDCHSNGTVWSFYVQIAPLSRLVTFDMALR